MMRATSQLTTRFRARGLADAPAPVGQPTPPLPHQGRPATAASPLTWLGQGLLSAFQARPEPNRRG